jgi:hypothetical protein
MCVFYGPRNIPVLAMIWVELSCHGIVSHNKFFEDRHIFVCGLYGPHNIPVLAMIWVEVSCHGIVSHHQVIEDIFFLEYQFFLRYPEYFPVAGKYSGYESTLYV